MTLSSGPIASLPIAAAAAVASSSGAGALAPFTGFGVQGSSVFRGERFWATETRTRWRARESDSQDMLGTTDKDPSENVWYEVDFLDVLNGASITELIVSPLGSVLSLAQETASNGEQTHLARALISGGGIGVASSVRFFIRCSDGSRRVRTLKVRIREL